MTDTEKKPLINKHGNIDEHSETGIEWKHYVIIPVVAVALIAIGLEFYTSTQWIQHYVKQETFSGKANITAFDGCKAKNHSDPDYIAYERVQSKSAEWQLYKNVAGCIPAFCANMVLPSYSDSLGRRFLFIIAITSILCQLLIEAAAVYFNLHLYVFVLAPGICWIFGGYYTIFSASYSYIADITKNGAKRTLGISTFDGFLLACITLSGLGCGYIITYTSFFVPMATSCILMSIALLLTIFFLPETHKKENRTKSASVYRTLQRTVDFYGSSAFKGRRMAYILLLLSYFFQEITSTHRSSMEMIYQLGMPLCWAAEKVGIFTALRHAAQAFAGIILIVPLKACLSELAIALWSTLFNAGSFVMEAIVQTDLTMYLVSIPATLSFLTVPMIKSIMSIMTPPDKQGSLFASVTAVQSICGIVANLLLNSTYAATVSFMDGFVFLVLAGICMIVSVLLCIFGLTQKHAYNPTPVQKNIKVQADEKV